MAHIGVKNRSYSGLYFQMLLCLYFLSIPFTWSFLFIVSGFLIRLNDVAILLMIVSVGLTHRIMINRWQQQYLMLFGLLIFFILLSSTANSYTSGLISSLKITYYLVGAICASQIIVSQEFVAKRVLILMLSMFFIYFLLFKPIIFQVIITNISSSYRNPAAFAYLFWNDIFNINLFGGSNIKEVVGVSFRNTAGLGFLTIAMFIFAVVRNSNITMPLTLVFLIACFATLSRSAGVCALLFIVLFGLLSKLGKQKWFYILLIVVGVIALSSSFLFQIVTDRIGSRFGRGELIRVGLNAMFDHPLFGAAADGKATSAMKFDSTKTVHNVPVALGAEYGVLAFFFATAILVKNFQFAYYFYNKTRSRLVETTDLSRYIASITCCAALVVSPLVSASAEVFYSAPLWAGLSIIFATYRKSVQVRNHA